MKSLLAFFLLLIPATVSAQDIFDVSCANLERIRIARVDDTYWNIETYDGHFYVLDLELKPDAAREFVKVRNAASTLHILYRGEVVPREYLMITTNGKPVREDVPTLTGFPDQGINIAVLREEDAFEMAREICPDLVPDKVLMDGHWE